MARPKGDRLHLGRRLLAPFPSATIGGAARKRLLRQETVSVGLFLLVLGLVLAYFAIQSPYFLTTGNFLRAFKNLASISIVSLGLTFVVAVGHADMSFHFVSCFAAMTMSYFIGEGYAPLPSIAYGIIAGLVFGLIDGIAVGVFRLPDMIATIGIGSAAWGMAYLYSNGNYIYDNFFSSGIIDFSDAKWMGISYPILYMAALFIAAYVLLHRTKYGRGFYSTGSNRVAAEFSGIRTARYIVAAFVICVVLASFANMIRTAAQGNGNVKGGLVLLMPAYAAVFVGMSVFRKPTVLGTFLGAFLISIMQNGFTLLSASFYTMDLIVGLTLIVSIIISRTQFRFNRGARPDSRNAEPATAAD
jgi:ribose transport system permease protein